MKIFLDLDGVIANFSKSASKCLDIPYPVQHEFKQYDELFAHVPKPVFYSKIRGHDFWANLGIFPYAKDLVKMIDTVSDGNWMFLTKPMMDFGCYSGKFAWVQKHFPQYLGKIIIINGTKATCCTGANDILVDDTAKNINEWAAAGGHAIRWVEKTDDFDAEWYKTKVDFLKYFIEERKNPIEL